MAKDKLTEYSATNASNDVIGDISVAEGMLPSAVNNALREQMTHLKNFSDGTDPIDGLTVTGNVSVDGGTIKLDGNHPVGTGNVALGDTALDSNVSGASNTAIGADALTANTASSNTAVGYVSLTANTTGANNVALGSNSLQPNTTGSANTALGKGASASNSTGNNNTSVGFEALVSNTTASSNTAVGYQASYSGISGQQNTTLGTQAGYSNLTGNGVVAVGRQALYSSTVSDNTAVGHTALVNNTTGTLNTALGGGAYGSTVGALGTNTTGSHNTAIGHSALKSSTTASNNTALGHEAGYNNTTGLQNVFLGRVTAKNSTTGTYLTAVGDAALEFNTTGILNTAVGLASGRQITTGSKNSILGAYNGNQSGLDIRTSNNNIVLSDGDGNPRLHSNSSGQWLIADTAVINNSSLTVNTVAGTGGVAITNGTYHRQLYQSSDQNFYFNNGSNQAYLSSAGSWTNASDARLKTNVRDIEYGLDTVVATQPRHFERVDVDGTYVGFVAQELQTVIPEVVSGDPDTQLGVDYGSLVAVAFKAIQEQQETITALEARIAALEGAN